MAILRDSKPVSVHGSGKPKLSLIDPAFLANLAEVLENGNEKYGKQDWMNIEDASWSDVIDAVLRHVAAFSSGESIDDESGKSHLIHAVARLMILNWYYSNKVGNDDRCWTY